MGALHYYWLQLRATLWFVPFLFGIGAVTAAFVLLEIDLPMGTGTIGNWLYSGDPNSARGLLESLLTGMITMTALVVSITMVVLALAAAQLGPRLIRSFTDDRVTQCVLGLFIGTILYLLVVLRAIDAQNRDELPNVAITGGTALCAICLFVLLFYINKLARSIVSNHLLRRVKDDSSETSVYVQDPGQRDDTAPGGSLPWDERAECAFIRIDDEGYLQNVDLAALVLAANRTSTVIRLRHRPGQWIIQGAVVADVAPQSACTADLRKSILSSVSVGSTRTPSQDLEFNLQRMVEVGLRALSPSLNDPFTAIAALDNIGAALARIFERGRQRTVLHDEAGHVRVLRPVVDWEELIDAAFDQMRHFGAPIPTVTVRLLQTIGELAPHVRTEAQRRALLDQLDATLEAAQAAPMVKKDAATILRAHAKAQQELKASLLGDG